MTRYSAWHTAGAVALGLVSGCGDDSSHLTCTATLGEQSSPIDVSSKPGSTGQGSIDDFLINCTMLSKSQLRMAVVRPSSGQSIMTAEAGGPPASGAAATDKGLLEFGYR